MLETLGRTDAPPPPIGGAGASTLRGGRVTAPLCGGSLTLIAATLGTPFELDTRGRILCLEDVGERPYRLDRLLQQLELAGKLRDAAGIAVGEMLNCDEPGGRGRPLLELYEHFLAPLGVPVAYDLPFGHGAANDTLPLGAEAELDADAGTLRVIAPVVA
jgi:muramoyltetrapeptide carboxypeptidase